MLHIAECKYYLARCRYFYGSARPSYSAAFKNIPMTSRPDIQRYLYIDIDADGHLSVQIRKTNNSTAVATTYYCLRDSLSYLNFQRKSEMKFTNTHFLFLGLFPWYRLKGSSIGLLAFNK